jgi:hypothetical protein
MGRLMGLDIVFYLKGVEKRNSWAVWGLVESRLRFFLFVLLSW